MIGSVIKLHLIEDTKDGKKKNKEYTFDQLCDLQSKLMLVAGKTDHVTAVESAAEGKHGAEDVERFVEVRTGLVCYQSIVIPVNYLTVRL